MGVVSVATFGAPQPSDRRAARMMTLQREMYGVGAGTGGPSRSLQHDAVPGVYVKRGSATVSGRDMGFAVGECSSGQVDDD